MPPPMSDNPLVARHYITLIVRLTLDRAGRLIQGELVDTTDTPQQRFSGVAGMNQAIRDWLTQHVQAEDDTQRPTP